MNEYKFHMGQMGKQRNGFLILFCISWHTLKQEINKCCIYKSMCTVNNKQSSDSYSI